jgi:predicted ATPase
MIRRLSIFAGPFDAAAAGSVAADTATATDGVDEALVDDLLGELVERSMLLVDPGRSGRRFRLLETIREFAAVQLATDDHAALIAGRHTQWCL